MGVLFLSRQSISIGCIILVDYYTANPIIIGNTPSGITITKVASTGSLTVDNATAGTVQYVWITGE